jgi:quercetin 2,3-dioxygenase
MLKTADLPASSSSQPRIIRRSSKRRHRAGGFSIEILLPGLGGDGGDSGIGSIGRIDDASVSPGTLVAMHPHQNDEILTYLKSGRVLHKDTVGDEEWISPTRLMLMNAGERFQHEELVDPEGGQLRALQIFLRPRAPGMAPQVQFHEFPSRTSEQGWRRIAGPLDDDPLVIRSATWVNDGDFPAGLALDLPPVPAEAATRLLYVFAGSISIGGIVLEAGDAVVLTRVQQDILTITRSELVLLTTDTTAPVYKHGMFSGNLL